MDPSDLFLTTKFTRPTLRSSHIPRPRLVRQLEKSLATKDRFKRRLSLISASAGYGKTSLALEWLNDKTQPIAWLSLDESDNDTIRFLAYLTTAVQQVIPGFGQRLLAMLQSPQPLPSQVILTVLLNEVASNNSPFFIILDDYHEIHDLQTHKNLAFILEHQPENLHMVIITRQDPLLPLAKLRVRGQLTEIRQDALRFIPSEVNAYFRQVLSVELSEQETALLEERTEGWAAGLQLASLTMQQYPDRQSFLDGFTGSSRYILDYLMEEVFTLQPPDVQHFLLATSILERLNGSLCDALIGSQDSQERLSALERANLFILPLDPSRQWFRYHRLFADLLRNRLRSDEGINQADLHLKASAWFQNAGHLRQAVQHAQLAKDWGLSAVLIEQASDQMLKNGEIITLINWCRKLPDKLFQSKPQLSLTYAWALLLSGQFDPAEGLLTNAERAAVLKPALLGQVYAAQSYLVRARGDNRKVIEISKKALALLPESDLTQRSTLMVNLGLVYWHEGRLEEALETLQSLTVTAQKSENYYALFTALIFIARVHASRGELLASEAMLQEIAVKGEGTPISTLTHFDLGAIYYEWNQLDKAAEQFELGLAICQRTGNQEFQHSGHLLRAFLRNAQGDMAGAMQDIQTAHELASQFSPETQSRSAASHAQLALMQGDLDTAEHWTNQMQKPIDPHSLYRFISLVQPRLLLAQEKKPEALTQLEGLHKKALNAGWGYAQVVIELLLAQAAAKDDEALQYIQSALAHAEPEGYLRSFLDAGPGLLTLLEKAARKGISRDYIARILAAAGSQAVEIPKEQPLFEPLSGRELEVLRLVAAGLSNREIASSLYISTGTAKTHVHNLCGKLGVRNRTEAATRAHELDLLS